jgi:DNA polymerase elongation subunit (family B)
MIKMPKILILDIETIYMTYRTWSPKLNSKFLPKKQMIEDWSILAWAAKWRGEKKIYYKDTGSQKNKRDDSKILKSLFKLMDEADIIVGKNSDRFDIPKINARFLINNINDRKPPNKYQKQDVEKMMKPFGFTYKSLEYVSEALNLKNKKLVKRKFEGLDLWIECVEKNNKEAWAEMRKYNPMDILATEEAYNILMPWTNKINFNVFNNSVINICQCGSNDIRPNGYDYQKTGTFKRFRCHNCGHPFTDKTNLLPSIKRKEMLK